MTGHHHSEARGSQEDREPRAIPIAEARERIRTRIFDTPPALARAVAERIAAAIRRANAGGRRAVLGLATGSTPIGVYRELVRMHREEGLSFAQVETFNLDEYLPMHPESPHSYHRFMWLHLFSQVDIAPERVHILDGTLTGDAVAAHCAAFEAAIGAAGGIDFQLLGIGKTGHIGFNEPGSGLESRTRRVHLDRVTRRDAASGFFSEKNVPREALTMGIATILAAREIAILATGEHKSAIVRRAVEGEVDHGVPATFLQRHPDATFYCDGAAAAELTRVATPWLVDEVQWTDALEIRAAIWLSGVTGRAVLKLSETDYEEHHLSGLVARHGEAGDVNGKVFRALSERIRGRAKLPHHARIVCFSPHPDDDVISMGGILRKLIQNDNEITVAYMTSGNIAVFDHDVRRHLDVVMRVARERGFAEGKLQTYTDRVLEAMAAKQPGEIDPPEVADLKRIIRESEAVSGIETLGLDGSHGRFLDLPFYRTGTIEKKPVGPEDVAIVKALLEEKRPHYIFVAGDLSDPHGTHRVCKDAIDAAVAQLHPVRAHGPQEPPPEYIERTGGAWTPEVWLYRGAWQEWPVSEATWLVPLSREELRLKIQAIFKHQSQKDSAPFPGQDEREFWQRVEQRNTGTADLLDRLGLAEYNAIEAYVVD
jgi:glucosamine-6-phosphate deaminase